jgi:hypothetical protein
VFKDRVGVRCAAPLSPDLLSRLETKAREREAASPRDG